MWFLEVGRSLASATRLTLTQACTLRPTACADVIIALRGSKCDDCSDSPGVRGVLPTIQSDSLCPRTSTSRVLNPYFRAALTTATTEDAELSDRSTTQRALTSSGGCAITAGVTSKAVRNAAMAIRALLSLTTIFIGAKEHDCSKGPAQVSTTTSPAIEKRTQSPFNVLIDGLSYRATSFF